MCFGRLRNLTAANSFDSQLISQTNFDNTNVAGSYTAQVRYCFSIQSSSIFYKMSSFRDIIEFFLKSAPGICTLHPGGKSKFRNWANFWGNSGETDRHTVANY